jgi:hypothetical protein
MSQKVYCEQHEEYSAPNKGAPGAMSNLYISLIVLMSGGILALFPINVQKSLVPGKRAAAAFNSDTSNLSTFLASNKKK